MGNRLTNSLAISVVLRADEIPTDSPDLIVFPEGVSWDQMRAASSRHPNAVIVGGVDEGGRIRGVMLHAGENRIEYLKIGTDRRTEGSGDLSQVPPVYEFDEMCVGVVLCMDIDIGAFSRAVAKRIRSSKRPWKFLCVPADMASHWFPENSMGSEFAGIHVVVCNHTKTHQGRCASFVTDTKGNKILVQQKDEALHMNFGSAGMTRTHKQRI